MAPGGGRSTSEYECYVKLRPTRRRHPDLGSARRPFVLATLFVTNLALPLTAAVGDEPEEEVSRYAVSRMKVPNH